MTYVKQNWVDDDGSGTTGTTFTAARMGTIEQGIYDAHNPPLVTDLPANPVDGQLIDLLVDSAGTYGGPTVWRMRYRGLNPGGGANPAASKWDFVGGFPLYKGAVSPNISVPVGGAIPAGAPSFAVPWRGDFMVEFNAEGQGDTAGNYCYIYLYTTAQYGAGYYQYLNIAGQYVNMSAREMVFNLGANQTVSLAARTSAGTWKPEAMSMVVTPRRLGG
jgi:hypothetical protein